VQGHNVWLKFIGWSWIVAGVLLLAWGAAALISLSFSPLFFVLGAEAVAFWQAYDIAPWLQISALLLGITGLVAGLGLAQRQSWAQTLLLATHAMLALYAGVGWIGSFVLRSQLQQWWGGGPILLLALMVVNAGLAFSMGSLATTEALSWLPLRTSPVIPLRCEFCGTPLDPQTQLCPQCNAVPELIDLHIKTIPPRAALINLDDESEYRIDPDGRTSIGRGLTSNDIELSNPTVSRRHAQIEYRDGRFVLTALQDTNGTFINDTLVRQRTLRDGDEVRFGRARFQFQLVHNHKGQD
jgi:hypothetical protein